MKYTINEDAIKKRNLEWDEFFLLLSLSFTQNVDNVRKRLKSKGLITGDFCSFMSIKEEAVEMVKDILLDQEVSSQEDRLKKLAEKLKEVYPSGKKPGTNNYWAEGVALIVKRLALFFKKYGNEYTDEQIIEATKSYVQSFNGTYTYMKVLKYFIFKEKIGAAREVESESELLNYIENVGQDNINAEWTVVLK